MGGLIDLSRFQIHGKVRSANGRDAALTPLCQENGHDLTLDSAFGIYIAELRENSRPRHVRWVLLKLNKVSSERFWSRGDEFGYDESREFDLGVFGVQSRPVRCHVQYDTTVVRFRSWTRHIAAKHTG